MAPGTLEIFNDSRSHLDWMDHRALHEVISTIFRDFAQPFGWINVVFLDNKPHTELNINHLDHHYETDVLTFDFSDPESVNGEIYINVDVAQDNAIYYKQSTERELYRLIIHGILHLVGVNDKTEEEQGEMSTLEEKYLKRFM